ncbi:MAG: NAD(P)-binding domain-containing protein [Solirubrobacteraceae bacterium MAG38_C4-C5]|nr:NAD(P)-binding domain-containing protein [Candidatus Siliceabacter maunaloa]
MQHVDKAEDATITGDIVVLAVPYEALHEIVEQYGEQLRGRIVVDITNPVDFETFDALKVPAGSSASAELQAALPDARVLKAFNINFAATLSAEQVGPNTTTVLVCGDDEGAKETLIKAARGCGLAALDAGGARTRTSLRRSGSSNSPSPTTRRSAGRPGSAS